MRKVAVLMGGISSEREISCASGQGVLSALNQAGYSAFPVDLTHDMNAFVSIMNREKPEVVFNALHGKYGEDGCVQGVLNLMQIPYTHSGVMVFMCRTNFWSTARMYWTVKRCRIRMWSSPMTKGLRSAFILSAIKRKKRNCYPGGLIEIRF